MCYLYNHFQNPPGRKLKSFVSQEIHYLAEQRQESVVLIFEYQVNGWNIYKKNHREVEGCVKISKEKPIFNKIVISFLLRVSDIKMKKQQGRK